MRILFLSHCFPYPPDKGDRIRAFHELSHLGRRHSVHVLALGDPAESSRHEKELGRFCERVETFRLDRRAGAVRAALAAAGRRPLTLAFFHSQALLDRTRELAHSGQFDLVFAFTSAMAPYALQVPGVPRVLDMVDVDSAKWAQYAQYAAFPQHLVYHLESRRMERYEAALGGQFDRILLTTGREAEQLAAYGSEVAAEVVRNGICLETFRRLDLPRAEEPTLLFTGQMDYFANVDAICHFANTVFPVLQRRFPRLRLVVVGRSPTPRVLALEKIPGIAVTGTVSDVRPFLARATVFVAPLRIAQGVQNKALEAMASELPVVTTPAVLGGIADGGFEHGKHLLVADDDEAFIEHLTLLLNKPGLRRRMGAAARLRLTTAHSWSRNMAELEQKLEALVADHRRRTRESGPLEEARIA